MNATHPPAKRPVLVIDDSFYDLLIAREILEDVLPADEVLCMDSALKALNYLTENSNAPDELPRAIFLDIRMPVMDGFGFLERYGELPEALKSHCRIFMLTSSIDPADLQRAEKNPYVNRFLEKPLNEALLAGILDE